jgi:hypothetical protein
MLITFQNLEFWDVTVTAIDEGPNDAKMDTQFSYTC